LGRAFADGRVLAAAVLESIERPALLALAQVLKLGREVHSLTLLADGPKAG
jgi:hypothetical protein